MVWDVGTRPPARLAADILLALRDRRAFASGFVRFVTGVALVFFAALVARPGLPTAGAFTIVETAFLIAALLIEALIGADLRRSGRAPHG